MGVNRLVGYGCGSLCVQRREDLGIKRIDTNRIVPDRQSEKRDAQHKSNSHPRCVREVSRTQRSSNIRRGEIPIQRLCVNVVVVRR